MKTKIFLYLAIIFLTILTGCQRVGESPPKKILPETSSYTAKNSTAKKIPSLDKALEYYKKGEIRKAKAIFEKIEENGNIDKSIREKAGAMIDEIESKEKADADNRHDLEDSEEKSVSHRKLRKRAASSLFTPISSGEPVKSKAQLLIKQGDSFFVGGKFDEALKFYLNAIEENPKSGEAYIRTGDIYLRKAQYDKSGKAFKKALEINPDNKFANFGMADILIEKGNYTEAEKHLKKCLQIDNKFAPAYTTMGDLYVDSGKPGKAEKAFLKSLQVDPSQAYPGALFFYRETGKISGKFPKSAEERPL